MKIAAHRRMVYAEITRENRAVRQEFVRAFDVENRAFADQMGEALSYWFGLYSSAQGDERQMKVLALAYTAISLHINSMKLFLSGQQVAAGNLMRQVLETVALTYLCTDRKMLFLERFDEGRYSTSKAIADAKRHAERLKLSKAAISKLELAQKFYSKFSHPTVMTVGTLESFSGEGIYLGAAYDHGKHKHYEVEVSNRLKLAKLFVGFLMSVNRNLDAT
ncbi:MAG: hypothetical protein ACYCZI_05775 [Metallibacterium scheffleri]